MEWGSYLVELWSPSLRQCQEVISQLTDNHWDIRLISSTSDAFAELVPPALERVTVKWLSIYDTPLTTDSIISLSHLLSTNCSLKWLILSNCSINDEGVAALTDGLQDNKTLTDLWLHNNPLITSNSCRSLSRLLKNSSLSYLDLTRTSLDKDGVLLLTDTLDNNKTLTRLHLDERHRQTCYSLTYFGRIEHRLYFFSLK